MTDDEYLSIIRSLIDRETSLQNNRLTWFLASQALLTAACGVFWDKKPIYGVLIVSLLGFFSSVASFAGLCLCTLAIKFYREKAFRKIGQEIDPPVDYDHKALSGNSSWWLILLPWKILPLLFLLTWLLLAVARMLTW